MEEETKFVRKYVLTLACNGTKWLKLCLCAVKKLLTHSLTLACIIRNNSSSEDQITNVNVLQRHRYSVFIVC